MDDWKTRILLIAGVLGAVAGLAAGLLYIREVEASGTENPRQVETKDAISIGLASLAIIRQIASLGQQPND